MRRREEEVSAEEEEEEVEGEMKVEEAEGEQAVSEVGDSVGEGSEGQEESGESVGDRQYGEEAEAPVGSRGDGQGMRERDSRGQMGEGGGCSGRGERSAEEAEEVLMRRLEGEDLQRHIVGDEDRGGDGRAVRGETGMARVSIAPLPRRTRCADARVGAGAAQQVWTLRGHESGRARRQCVSGTDE